MSDDSDTSHVFAELYPLVIASLTGEITPDQVAQLEDLVCSDPRARRLYAGLIFESVNLRTWAESACEQATDETTATKAIVTLRRPSTIVRWVPVVAAAALVDSGGRRTIDHVVLNLVQKPLNVESCHRIHLLSGGRNHRFVARQSACNDRSSGPHPPCGGQPYRPKIRTMAMAQSLSGRTSVVRPRNALRTCGESETL